ncbi:MAG: hypothetical protein VX642_02610 [Bdellovibrionota bacterium]|nr:hypothetical protein [Bdellovibrionota bacterium]
MLHKLFFAFFFLGSMQAFAQVDFNQKELSILNHIYKSKQRSGAISKKMSFRKYINEESAVTMTIFRSSKIKYVENTDPFHRLQIYGDIQSFELMNGQYFLTAVDYNSYSPFPLHVQFGKMEGDKKFKSANRMPFRAENIVVRSVKVDGKLGVIVSAAAEDRSGPLKIAEIYIEFSSENVPEIKSLHFFDPYLEEKQLEASLQAFYDFRLFKVFQHSSQVYFDGDSYRSTDSKIKIENQKEIRKDLERTLLPIQQRNYSLFAKPSNPCPASPKAKTDSPFNNTMKNMKLGKKF